MVNQSQIHDLSRGVNRLCKNSRFNSQLTRVTDGQTDRQTDGNAISIAERLR